MSLVVVYATKCDYAANDKKWASQWTCCTNCFQNELEGYVRNLEVLIKGPTKDRVSHVWFIDTKYKILC